MVATVWRRFRCHFVSLFALWFKICSLAGWLAGLAGWLAWLAGSLPHNLHHSRLFPWPAVSLETLDQRLTQLERGTGTGGRQGKSFEDEVLRWLDADAVTRLRMVQMRRHDYSRKWYRRTISVTTMLLAFTHLLFVITQLVIEAPLSYFHVFNWIAVVLYTMGGITAWTHKTSWQARPQTQHSLTQWFFVGLVLFIFVAICAWFAHLFDLESQVADYCRDQPEGEHTGKTQHYCESIVFVLTPN